MLVFEREVKLGEVFEYRKGEVVTTIPWGRPSYRKVKNFLIYIQNCTNILSDYEVFVMGGVLFDFNTTWDLDIGLVGGNQTDIKLEEDLNYMADLALNKMNMLVDATWYKSRLENLTYSGMILNNFMQSDVEHKKVGYVRKQIENDIEELDLRTNVDTITLTEYLIQGNWKNNRYSKKMIDKVQNNRNLTTVTTFSAKEFLTTDENYFLTNTNR